MIAPNPDRTPPTPPPARRLDDPRRIAVVACVLLVTLRLFIGWQLTYEGFWKVQTLDTPRPWTSAGYLQNAQGPLRGFFREMSGDPDDLSWLDYDAVSGRWDDYRKRFLAQHPDLTDRQLTELKKLFVGEKDFRAEVKGLPVAQLRRYDKKTKRDEPVFEEDPETGERRPKLGPIEVPEDLRKFVTFNPQMQRIIVDGTRHLTAAEKQRLVALVGDLPLNEPEMSDSENYNNWELAKAYTEAIERVYQRATRLSYRERLGVALRGDPDAPRVVFGGFSGAIGDPDKLPEIDTYYRTLLDEYDEAVATAETPYQREHAETLYGEIQELKRALVGPVKSLDAGLRADMDGLLTLDQKARGPVPQPWTAVRIADALTITGLCTLGTLLLIGFLTRFASLMAGVMVLGFYLAWPPWPGVPEAPGPDHALVVNKNLIEVAALLALAALPTGRWFGVDGLLLGLWRKFVGRRDAARHENARPVAVEKKPAPADPVRRDAMGRETMPLAADPVPAEKSAPARPAKT